MIFTILIFIVILGVLVFVHEFGHFIVARKSGMKVEEFGFGFPPRIFGIQKINGKRRTIWGHPKQSLISSETSPDQDTLYSINLIPLGGFVKILGENNEHEEDPRSFINRSFGARFATLVAGVSMNVILAWVLISVGFIIGLPAVFGSGINVPAGATLKNPQIIIMEVVKDLPADKAGVKAQDILLSINGIKFNNLQSMQDYIKSHKGNQFAFEIKRGKEIVNVKVNSLANPAPDQGPTGIALENVGELQFPWYLAFFEGAKATVNQLGSIFSGLYGLITAKIGLSNLSGPVKIAQLTGEVAGMGFIYILQFAAFLSLNLAVLNIMPFPALDGGRVVFLLIEKIRGRRNNQKIEQFVNTAGFVLLLLLMLAVTIKDVKGF